MASEAPMVGKLADGNAKRDAIHIAIAPVVAAEELTPGQDIGPLADGRFGPCDKPIGIVDPFLRESVGEGERCFLFLYPNTITSLRHVWTHPAFVYKGPAHD